jgi:hypothetical protein
VENISEEIYKKACNTVFAEPPVDDLYEETIPGTEGARVFGVEYLPGQYDQRADSAVQCIQFLKEDETPIIKTATVYVISGNVSDEEFAKLLGHPIPDGRWHKKLGMNDAIAQLYYARSIKARLIGKVMQNMLKKSMEKGKPDLNIIFITNMPFRAIGKMTGGAVSQEMVAGMVKVVNGHFFGGLGQIIGGYFRNGRLNKKYEKKLKG